MSFEFVKILFKKVKDVGQFKISPKKNCSHYMKTFLTIYKSPKTQESHLGHINL